MNTTRLRTEDEIKAIAPYRGDVTYISNLQNGGEHDLVEAMFKHHRDFDISEIATAFQIVTEDHGEFRDEHLTLELLTKVSTISEGLHELMKDGTRGVWYPEDFKLLTRHFIDNMNDWELALKIIEMRRITNFKNLMQLFPQFKESASAPALLDGTL